MTIVLIFSKCKEFDLFYFLFFSDYQTCSAARTCSPGSLDASRDPSRGEGRSEGGNCRGSTPTATWQRDHTSSGGKGGGDSSCSKHEEKTDGAEGIQGCAPWIPAVHCRVCGGAHWLRVSCQAPDSGSAQREFVGDTDDGDATSDQCGSSADAACYPAGGSPPPRIVGRTVAVMSTTPRSRPIRGSNSAYTVLRGTVPPARPPPPAVRRPPSAALGAPPRDQGHSSSSEEEEGELPDLPERYSPAVSDVTIMRLV